MHVIEASDSLPMGIVTAVTSSTCDTSGARGASTSPEITACSSLTSFDGGASRAIASRILDSMAFLSSGADACDVDAGFAEAVDAGDFACWSQPTRRTNEAKAAQC